MLHLDAVTEAAGEALEPFFAVLVGAHGHEDGDRQVDLLWIDDGGLAAAALLSQRVASAPIGLTLETTGCLPGASRAAISGAMPPGSPVLRRHPLQAQFPAISALYKSQ